MMTGTIINTTIGKLRGRKEGGVYSFRGIPYGGPTGGKNRFKPPTRPEPWTGIKDATRYGPSCWQAIENHTTITILGAEGVDSMSEDCLVLNVWTSGFNDNGKRPVMVWLHGGGFVNGSGNHIPAIDGTNLARTGEVVIVTVNHRLGVFGYLHLEELAGEEYAGSGNAGMLDLIAALEWVRDNIEAFGGDPGNVMIFGESGGGSKVSYLMAMPGAEGLFHKAIIQSGPGLRAQTVEYATNSARNLLDMVGLNSARVHVLHQMRANTIYSAWLKMAQGSFIPGGDYFTPLVDGRTMPVQPFDPVAAPTVSKIPLIIGTTKDEMTFMMMRDPAFGKYDEETMRQRIVDNFNRRRGGNLSPDNVDEMIAGYRRIRPKATPHDILIAVTTDQMRMSSILLAERKIACGTAPVFMYLFTWESPAMQGMLKATHTLEIPFAFNNIDPPVDILGNSPERFQLALRMSNAWIAFAKNGDPNHGGIPQWPNYSSEDRSTMIFDKDCRIENDPFPDERKLWISK
ncbi:MAG: carboxylesterase/lipase family protein [Deltaproteobacteria bacterium]|nr:carboxylesterase/lipase family protein [Deltaproteobacteria bacterium]